MISFPPAKINIGLHIQSKRADGYHLLNAFFIPIELKDILEIVPAKDGNFRFEQSGISVDCDPESNLCVKAYRLLAEAYDFPPVHMHLHKQIPFGAGLGGGSADASYVLLELNKLFKLGISEEQLHAYALQLGADCPFFLQSQAAYVEGIGEHLSYLESHPLEGRYQLLLSKPEVSIPTAQAYAGVHISGVPIAADSLHKTPVEDWKAILRNDFEEHLFVQHPVLKELKEGFYQKGAVYASMTGSGAAVYGIYPKDAEINDKDFPHLIWRGDL